MESPTLTTQSNMNNPYAAPDGATLEGNEQTNPIVTDSSARLLAQSIDPNAIILAAALTDKAIAWRIHNCKVSKKTVTKDLPLPFLYHYDSLEDTIKQTHPLTPVLLAKFNSPMTANDAAKLIGIDEALISSPWHVKVIGSLVVFSEALQLAVRLHWTNTGKDTQQIYTKDEADAVSTAIKDWQFFGRVDVLYKNDKQTLISIDGRSVNESVAHEDGTLKNDTRENNANENHTDNDSIDKESFNEQSNEPVPLIIKASSDYQFLPATHALVVIAKLEADKETLPWFETAILERLA